MNALEEKLKILKNLEHGIKEVTFEEMKILYETELEKQEEKRFEERVDYWFDMIIYILKDIFKLDCMFPKRK